jgi:hypothetical protein
MTMMNDEMKKMMAGFLPGTPASGHSDSSGIIPDSSLAWRVF